MSLHFSPYNQASQHIQKMPAVDLLLNDKRSTKENLKQSNGYLQILSIFLKVKPCYQMLSGFFCPAGCNKQFSPISKDNQIH